MKRISVKTSIYDLAEAYPDFAEVMSEIGFQDILKPMMLQTAGRYMNLEKGAKLKKISWDKIRKVLADKGYEIIEEEIK